jgi:hypothetical protein
MSMNTLKKINPSAWFLVVVLAVMGMFFVTSAGYSEYKVKLMPMLTSGFTIVLSLVALIVDLKVGAKKTMPTDEDGDVIEDEKILGTPVSAYFKAFLLFALLIAMIYIFGFIIAIPVWMVGYLWKHGSRWWTAILIGVILTVIIYLVFTAALQVPLYPGAILEYLNL